MKGKLEEISFATPPQKIFRNIEHYKRVRTAILKALLNSKVRGTQKESNSSFLISRLVVRFTNSIKAEEIFIDYRNGCVVLEAPKPEDDSPKELTDRRMYYFSSLVRSVEAIATIGITHVYLVLDDKGRKELELQNRRRRAQ